MKIKFPLIFFYFLLFFSVYSQDGFTEKYKTNTDSTLIIITVNVDGKELPFLFDTGTQINVLFDDGTFNLKKHIK